MPETYTLNIRHRPDANDGIYERHNRYLQKQEGIGPPWELSTGHKSQLNDKDIGPGNIVSILKVGRRMGKGVSGGLSYSCRVASYLDDCASKDDSIILNFKLSNIDFEKLVLVDLPIFIEAFEAYTAEISVSDYSIHEFKEWQNFSHTNGSLRQAIFRIPPVSFYDRKLCLRAFKLTPEEIVKRLQGKVEKAYCHYDGVVIIVSSTPVDRETYLNVSENIKAILSRRQSSFFDIFKRKQRIKN
jgi:hypothetical protein